VEIDLDASSVADRTLLQRRRKTLDIYKVQSIEREKELTRDITKTVVRLVSSDLPTVEAVYWLDAVIWWVK
jgi:hypothetical protein